MKTTNLFPSTWLKAADLNGDTVVTIRDAKMELLGQGDDAEQKLVLSFNESDKGLAINVTNCRAIEGLYGNDTDDWIGQAITVYPTEVQFGGKMVEAIRVRLRKPQPAASDGPLSWEQAKALAAAAGHNEQWLKDELLSAGRNGFNSKRDSDLVRSLVQLASQPTDDSDNIPF